MLSWFYLVGRLIFAGARLDAFFAERRTSPETPALQQDEPGTAHRAPVLVVDT